MNIEVINFGKGWQWQGPSELRLQGESNFARNSILS